MIIDTDKLRKVIIQDVDNIDPEKWVEMWITFEMVQKYARELNMEN